MRRPVATAHHQRGVVTLLLSLVMLLLITAMVTTAYMMSSVNLRAVGNMQSRDEATAAANLIIEEIVGSSFTDAPTALTAQPIDINDDGNTDYTVDVATPVCVKASVANIASSSSVTLPGMSANSAWNTVWEIDATATDAKSGASVRVKHAIRVLLTQSQKDTVCA